jgi:hypothetical protein
MPKSKSPEPHVTATTGAKAGDTTPPISSGGNPYVKPLITPKLIDELSHNPYISSALRKLLNLIFSDYYKIWVEDPNGETDEELTQEMENLAESQGVRLWVTMQQAWMDRRRWGCMILNDVWGSDGGRRTIQQFRRLPPETFTEPPIGGGLKYRMYNPILRGITIDDKENLHLYQQGPNGKPVEVTNARIIKDPTDPRLGGTSDLEDLVGMLAMANYTWKSQMQLVNRAGVPIKLPRVLKDKGPRGIDNIKKAEDIAKNDGKDTSFILNDGIELEIPNVPVNNVIISTIDKIESFINNYFSPKSMLERSGGGSLGEGAGAKEDLTLQYLRREHRWIEDDFEEIFQEQLDSNLYKGYTVHIMIDKPERDNTTVEIQQVAEGWRDKIINYNEARLKLGLQEKSLEDMRKDLDERGELFPAPVMPVFPPFGSIPQDDDEEEGDDRKNLRHICMKDSEGKPTKEMLTLEDKILEIDRAYLKKCVKALEKEGPAT